MKKNILLAFVGMPGAGKSEAAAHLKKKGIPFVRFGDFTDEYMKQKGMEPGAESEQKAREKIRAELGMGAYAKHSLPKISRLSETHEIVGIDGLYSWEEYLILKTQFPHLILIHVYAEPAIRYQRLAERPVRRFTLEESRTRDLAEIEHLNKGGPIAIADYLVENNADLDTLQAKMEILSKRLDIV